MKKVFFNIVLLAFLIGFSFYTLPVNASNEYLDLEIFGWNFGELEISNFSLPVITFLIAFLDGFNPCAMWVLLFLISLLIEEKSVFKRWFLGGIFLLASGVSYYAFLVAWLNINQLIGLVSWSRLIIACVALIAGLFSIKGFFSQDDKVTGCKVGQKAEKQKITKKLQNIISQKSLWLATVGILILAFSINLFELLCSATLPAIYTNILAGAGVSGVEKYLYLLLYTLVFMLDDFIIFAIAMLTLQATGISNKYNKLLKLISGIVMIFLAFWLFLEIAQGYNFI